MSSHPGTHPRPIRVVVVDDSPEFLAQVRELVARTAPLEMVGAAPTAGEGLALLARVPADLVLMDFRLPGVNGFEATRQIKQRGADAPKVVIVSFFAGPEYQSHARAGGADGYLAKADLGGTLGPLVAQLFGAPGGAA